MTTCRPTGEDNKFSDHLQKLEAHDHASKSLCMNKNKCATFTFSPTNSSTIFYRCQAQTGIWYIYL